MSTPRRLPTSVRTAMQPKPRPAPRPAPTPKAPRSTTPSGGGTGPRGAAGGAAGGAAANSGGGSAGGSSGGAGGEAPASSAGDAADVAFAAAKAPGAKDKGKPKEGAKPWLEVNANDGPMERALKGDINEYQQLLDSEVPAHQGVVGKVAKGINVVLGGLNLGATLLDTAFAHATAGLAAMLPAFPAATVGSWHIGIPHGHSHPPSLIPPAPPIPLPSAGVIMASCASNVLINGMPAARAGDCGIAPVCFSFAPPFEITTGSSNVFIGGSRAARQFDVTIHCNPLGVIGALGKIGKCLKVVAKAGKVGTALKGVAKVGKVAEAAGKASKLAKVAEGVGLGLGVLGLAAGGLAAVTSDLDADKAKKDADEKMAKAQAAAAEAAKSGDADAAADAANQMADAQSAAASAAGAALAASLAAAQAALDAAGMALSMLQGKDPGIPPAIGAIAIKTSPNVHIGGIPTPNLMDCLKGLLKAVGGQVAKKMKKGDSSGEGGGAPSKTAAGSCPP